MRWAGVDVGGRKGFDAAVIEQRNTLHLLWPPRREVTAEGVVSLLAESRPSVIAVDSPISPAPPGSRSRECERALRAHVCNIRYTPDLATMNAREDDYYGWILNGLSLYEALKTPDASWCVIECFPTASWTRLGGPRVGTRRAWSSRVLRDHFLASGLLTGVPSRLNQDGRDAIVAAYTAYLHGRGLTEPFGDLVVPAGSNRAG